MIKCANCGKMFKEEHEDDQETDCEGRKICFDCFNEQFGYCDGEGCGKKIKYNWAFRQIDREDVDGVWCDKCWIKEKARLLALE